MPPLLVYLDPFGFGDTTSGIGQIQAGRTGLFWRNWIPL